MIGRMFIVQRRYDEALAYARPYLANNAKADEARDVMEAVLREQGRYRDAAGMFDLSRRSGKPVEALVYGHTLGTLGQADRARAEFERDTWHPRGGAGLETPDGLNARGFAWHHALEADALRLTADTAALRAIADSVERVGSWSYYARDWTIHHHVRGLLAERTGDLRGAKRHFELALSLVAGFTRTNVELAKVDVALGEGARAVEVMRSGYWQPIDAMGRYAPRSEMDYQMSLAYASVGQLDSARKFAAYVRTAWAHADREHRAKLADLPH